MPTHYRRGWHITATCGIFGAAAACARLIGLDARRTAWALGHAATAIREPHRPKTSGGDSAAPAEAYFREWQAPTALSILPCSGLRK
jgi:2-methylcitrate dehydratase PrpD